MRTTMNIPKDLLKEAARASNAASQTQAVILGLQELILKKKREELLALQGSGVLQLSRRAARRQRTR